MEAQVVALANRVSALEIQLAQLQGVRTLVTLFSSIGLGLDQVSAKRRLDLLMDDKWWTTLERLVQKSNPAFGNYPVSSPSDQSSALSSPRPVSSGDDSPILKMSAHDIEFFSQYDPGFQFSQNINELLSQEVQFLSSEMKVESFGNNSDNEFFTSISNNPITEPPKFTACPSWNLPAPKPVEEKASAKVLDKSTKNPKRREQCSCGSSLIWKDRRKHFGRAKHISWMKSKPACTDVDHTTAILVGDSIVCYQCGRRRNGGISNNDMNNNTNNFQNSAQEKRFDGNFPQNNMFSTPLPCNSTTSSPITNSSFDVKSSSGFFNQDLFGNAFRGDIAALAKVHIAETDAIAKQPLTPGLYYLNHATLQRKKPSNDKLGSSFVVAVADPRRILLAVCSSTQSSETTTSSLWKDSLLWASKGFVDVYVLVQKNLLQKAEDLLDSDKYVICAGRDDSLAVAFPLDEFSKSGKGYSVLAGPYFSFHRAAFIEDCEPSNSLLVFDSPAPQVIPTDYSCPYPYPQLFAPAVPENMENDYRVVRVLAHITCPMKFNEGKISKLKDTISLDQDDNSIDLTMKMMNIVEEDAVILSAITSKNDKEVALMNSQKLKAAAKKSDLETARALLNSKNTDVNHQDKHGRTAVHWASYSQSADILNLLIEHKARLDLADENGWNSLHWAVNGNAEANVKLILQSLSTSSKSNMLHEKDNDGRTPIFWANVNGTAGVLNLLENEMQLLSQPKMTRPPASAAPSSKK